MSINSRYNDLRLLLQRINDALEHLEQDMQSLSDGDIGRTLYTEYQQRFAHIQSLFDHAADLLQGSTANRSNPELYPILECKEDLNRSYGRYRRMSNRFTRLHARAEIDRDEYERERGFAEPSSDLPEEEELSQDEELVPDQGEDLSEDLLWELEEEAAEKEQQEKKQANRQRQEKLARAGKEREAEFLKQDAAQQDLRRQEAARMAVHTTPDQLYSEADLRNERLRQDDERLRQEQEDHLRRTHNQELADNYRQRMEESKRYDGEQKGHFDFSAQPSENAQNLPPADQSPRYEATPHAERPYPTPPQSSAGDPYVPSSRSEEPPYDSDYTPPKTAQRRDWQTPYMPTPPADSRHYEAQNPPEHPTPSHDPRPEIPASHNIREPYIAPFSGPEPSPQQSTSQPRGSEYEPIPLHPDVSQAPVQRDSFMDPYRGSESFHNNAVPSESQPYSSRRHETEPRYTAYPDRPVESRTPPPFVPSEESTQFAKPEHSVPSYTSFREPPHHVEDSPARVAPYPQDPGRTNKNEPNSPVPSSKHDGELPYTAVSQHRMDPSPHPMGEPISYHQEPQSRGERAPKQAEPFVSSTPEPVHSQDVVPKRSEPQIQNLSHSEKTDPYGPIPFSKYDGVLPYAAATQHRTDPNLSPTGESVPSRQAPQSRGDSAPKQAEPFVSSSPEAVRPQDAVSKQSEPQHRDLPHPDKGDPFGPIPFSKHDGGLPYAATSYQTSQGRSDNTPKHSDPTEYRREVHRTPPDRPAPTDGIPIGRAEVLSSPGNEPRQYTPHSVPNYGKSQDTLQKGGGTPPFGAPQVSPLPEPHESATTPRTLFRYVPGGVAEQKLGPPRPVSLTEHREGTLTKSDNSKIYAAIKAGMPAQSGQPHTISPAYESQMQYNLESAKLQYRQMRGTSGASAAAHAYMEQRKAYMALKSDIKEGRIQIAPVSVLDPKTASSKSSEPKQPKSGISQYFYTPTGLYGRLIENAQVTGSQCQISQAGNPAPFAYSAATPLVVSPAYESALKSRADRASAAVNHAVATSKVSGRTLRFHPTVNQEVILATTAYIGFQRAKQSGQVIVSKDSSNQSPDFTLWSQRYMADRSRSAAVGKGGYGGGSGFNRSGDPSKIIGTTGQSKGPNPNKVTKQEVEEKVANIFGKSTKLKRETLIAHYGKSIGYKLEGYGSVAIARASRKLYYMAQNGNEDGPETIRTFEQGRYYLKTAVDVRLAIKNFHVVNAKGAMKTGAKMENKLYGKYASMSKKELKQYTHQAIQHNRTLKCEIKELWKKGAALTAEERKELLLKTAKLANSSMKVNFAVGFQKFRQNNDLAVKAAQDMEARRHLLTKPSQIDAAIKEIRTKAEKKISKKFGDLAKYKDKHLKKQANLLIQQGRELKEQIKLLQSKGSALTHSERKYLMSLMKKHADLNAEIKKYTGLLSARAKLNRQLAPYLALRKQIIKNTQALGNGLYALHNILLKPIREGSEVGAQGLAKAASIVANRHVRAVVKKTVKAEIAMGRWAIKTTKLDQVSKTAVRAATKAVSKTKAAQSVKTGAHVTSAAIKTAANAGKNAAIKMTPQFVKTAAHKTIAGRNLVRNAMNRLRSRVANSTFGRAFSAVRRTLHKATQGIRAALSFIKGFLIKTGLAILGFILIFGLVIGIVEIITTAASSVIMAPSTEDGSKIDLAPYVEIIKEEQRRFESEITAIKTNPDYDTVAIEYLTTTSDNTREMLSMMAVRMSQDLDMSTNKEVEPYLRSLYNDSHFYTTKKTNYKCSGCKTETVEVPHSEECPENCAEDHSYQRTYCDGHIRVDVKVSILSFDEIFTADTLGNAEGNAKQGSLIGHATVTYYCAEKYPHICNAGPPYETALGTTPTPGRTIAVDKKRIPLGTHVIIDGHEYVAEDTGGAIDELDIDIVVATHAQALAKGKRYNVPVYHVVYEGEGIQETGKWNGWTEDNIEWCKAICYADWADLYDGIDGIAHIVGLDTDLSGVHFVDGDRAGNEEIVDIALSQVGNVGGRPYWSWYGFNSRVEWCATFVSWCAYKDGSLNDSVPKFAACQSQGVPWFKQRGQWAARGDIVPVAGDIIFFDWEPNASANHVGIVVGSDGSKVYTVEGNSSDRVRTKSYPLDSPYILGYGIPNY